MVTVNITVTDEAVQPEIYLGRQGEKQAREIVFDLSALREKYGAGTATLYHQRSKDPAPYLIAETTGTTMTWTVSETDTVYAGIGYCEFRYTFGTEGLSKSTMFATNVKASLSGDVIIPAALQAWYDALIEYIDAGMDGQGITNDIKDALLQIASKVVYVDGGGQTYYNALYDALYPAVRYSVTNMLSGCTTSNDATTAASGSSYSATITANTGYSLTGATVSVTMDGIDITSTAYNNGVISIASVSGAIVIAVTAVAITLSSISAVYTQSGTVYDTDSLDSLKSNLVVTATYNDNSSATVPSADYTLSGTLEAGTSTITVSYSGKTTTFNVTVTATYTLYDYIYNPTGTNEAENSFVDTGIEYASGWSTLNIEFEAMNGNNGSASEALLGSNTITATDKGNILWYARANKAGFSAYNLGVAKQLNMAPGDTRCVCEYFFSDGGESYMQYESNTVAVATVAKSSVTSNGKSLILAGGRQASGSGLRLGLAYNRSKLGYVKFTDPSTGNTVYNFVPCHNVKTDKYGFYDTVNSVFYPENGTLYRCGNWS